jgi:hypothetical protein
MGEASMHYELVDLNTLLTAGTKNTRTKFLKKKNAVDIRKLRGTGLRCCLYQLLIINFMIKYRLEMQQL